MCPICQGVLCSDHAYAAPWPSCTHAGFLARLVNASMWAALFAAGEVVGSHHVQSPREGRGGPATCRHDGAHVCADDGAGRHASAWLCRVHRAWNEAGVVMWCAQARSPLLYSTYAPLDLPWCRAVPCRASLLWRRLWRPNVASINADPVHVWGCTAPMSRLRSCTCHGSNQLHNAPSIIFLLHVLVLARRSAGF